MPGSIAPFPYHQFFNDVGDPLAGGLLWTYAAGTNNSLSTYSDADLTSANPVPIVLDAAGRAKIWLPQGLAFKFVLANPTDTTNPPTSPLWSIDGVFSVPLSSVNTDIQGTAGGTITAGDAVFLSDGSGGRQAGRWYPTDADDVNSSKNAPATGFALANQLNNGQLAIRTAGKVTGLSSLTPGAAYYVSSTAGGTTSTLPAFGTPLRLLGYAASITELILAEKPKAQTRERVWSQIVSVGNVGAGEDTLGEYIAPAGELSADHMRYEIEAFGATTNNANAKTLRLRLIEGANNTVVLAFALTVSEAGFWRMTATVLRTSTTNAKVMAEAKVGPVNGPVSRTGTNLTAVTPAVWANAVTYRITGDATTTGDITLEGGAISLKD